MSPIRVEFEAEVDYRASGRPSLPIRVARSETERGRQFLAVIDTGASSCVLDRVRATQIGLVLEDPPPDRLESAGGPVPGWFETVTIEVLPIQLVVPARVFFQAAPRIHPLVGLRDVLDRLMVGIRHGESRLWLARDADHS